MFPRTPQQNINDRPVSYTQTLANLFPRLSSVSQFSYFYCNVFSKFSVWVLRSYKAPLTISTFANRIHDIVMRSSSKNMQGIKAARRIAMVTTKLIGRHNCFIEQVVSETMNVNILSFIACSRIFRTWRPWPNQTSIFRWVLNRFQHKRHSVGVQFLIANNFWDIVY